jgi:hypothetical protein
VDCVEGEDPCTAACQPAADRNYKVLTLAVKNGETCIGPTDCQPGAGACQTTSTTTTVKPNLDITLTPPASTGENIITTTLVTTTLVTTVTPSNGSKYAVALEIKAGMATGMVVLTVFIVLLICGSLVVVGIMQWRKHQAHALKEAHSNSNLPPTNELRRLQQQQQQQQQQGGKGNAVDLHAPRSLGVGNASYGNTNTVHNATFDPQLHTATGGGARGEAGASQLHASTNVEPPFADVGGGDLGKGGGLRSKSTGKGSHHPAVKLTKNIMYAPAGGGGTGTLLVAPHLSRVRALRTLPRY